MNVLLDSNVLIYSVAPYGDDLRHWLEVHSIYISKISEVEVLGYHKISESERISLLNIIKFSHLLSIDDLVIQQAIILRQFKAMSIGDSIVAATALLNKMTLITSNTKDFKHISNLNLLNPLDL